MVSKVVLGGKNWGTPEKNFNIFFNIFLKALCEKSNTFQPLLNTYFRAFSNLLSSGSLGPPPFPLPGDKRVNIVFRTPLHTLVIRFAKPNFKDLFLRESFDLPHLLLPDRLKIHNL